MTEAEQAQIQSGGYDALLTGVEQYEDSPAFGQVVVERVNLWDSPERRRVMASARQGQPIKVMGARYYNGRWYYLVEATDGESAKPVDKLIARLGIPVRLRGWVSQPFVISAKEPTHET